MNHPEHMTPEEKEVRINAIVEGLKSLGYTPNEGTRIVSLILSAFGCDPSQEALNEDVV